MPRILDGKAVAHALAEQLKNETEALKARGIVPTLAIVRVGARDDDLAYERGAIKRAQTVGVGIKQFVLAADSSQGHVDDVIRQINGDEGIDFFPANDLDCIPKGAINDIFVPIDDYIDFEDPLFKETKPIADMFMWKGKHYVIANNVTGDNCVVIYNRETVEENGL